MSAKRETVALLSDVHGNLEAFTAVLDDIHHHGVKTVINLGDVVGYGPDPEACIDLAAEHCTVNLCGNHDHAVLFQAIGFNAIARAAVDFVRARLKPDSSRSDPDRERRWRFLESLAQSYSGRDFVAMHGSPRQPVTEYILPSDPEADFLKLQAVFSAMTKPLAFVGHTHFPGVIEEGRRDFIMPQYFYNKYALGDTRAIINVGSVGQPRDRDIRSCYVIYDGAHVVYRRVEYDLEATVNKIKQSGGLHEACGLRLREGR